MQDQSIDNAHRVHATRAIEEATRCSTNARVGAVLARGATILATGFKGERDGLHAEQVVLAKALELNVDCTEAVLYTTMEPCANSRTNRISCAELIGSAGIMEVHIGTYDPNPQVYRLGWRHLRDCGVRLYDFPADLRVVARVAGENFTRVFTEGFGMSSGAKFDFTQNGGRFTIFVDQDENTPSWETQWSNCEATAIYMYGGHPGVVGHARYANDFDEIDDPDALEYGDHSPRIEIGSIGVMRNDYGHVLCKVVAIEPTLDYGGTGHVSVKIKWEIRLRGASRN